MSVLVAVCDNDSLVGANVYHCSKEVCAVCPMMGAVRSKAASSTPRPEHYFVEILSKKTARKRFYRFLWSDINTFILSQQ